MLKYKFTNRLRTPLNIEGPKIHLTSKSSCEISQEQYDHSETQKALGLKWASVAEVLLVIPVIQKEERKSVVFITKDTPNLDTLVVVKKDKTLEEKEIPIKEENSINIGSLKRGNRGQRKK